MRPIKLTKKKKYIRLYNKPIKLGMLFSKHNIYFNSQHQTPFSF